MLLEDSEAITTQQKKRFSCSWSSHIIPTVVLGAMFPTSVILARLLREQLNNSRPSSMDSGVALVPILSVGIDMASIAVLSISVLGLIGVIRGCRRLMNLYFGLVLAFIGVQVGYAVARFISGTSWIEASLERSWGDAYHKDPSMIYDLQTEFNCRGFKTQDDRAVDTPGSDVYLPPCSQVLETMYGSQLDRMGSMIVCIRLIQLGSVFLLSILFKYLAVLDSESSSIEPGSPSERSLSDDELPFFVPEKQLEDHDARIPLLFPESEEPECSNEAHFAESAIRRQGYQPVPGKVDESVVVVVVVA
ncbi:hypothetical protein BG006_004780 [Podila minutissima]|uniref:Tetraspanin n=1 Tax=Podila minutissima TaxID=64525 RepID=A0A9P5SKN6_9FUNG|nr:hypothetical protein BG006_004780 [Podila minutissima]